MAQQQKLARRQEGDGGGSSGVDDCNPERRMVQQNLARWQDGNNGGRGGVDNCDPERRKARQRNLVQQRDGNKGSSGRRGRSVGRIHHVQRISWAPPPPSAAVMVAATTWPVTRDDSWRVSEQQRELHYLSIIAK